MIQYADDGGEGMTLKEKIARELWRWIWWDDETLAEEAWKKKADKEYFREEATRIIKMVREEKHE
ncbi:MAG: hypothetical protein H7831_16350 [Magnetococcus sp. WYHC-3]